MKTPSHSAVDLKRILDSMETIRYRLIRIGVLVLLLSAGGYLLAGTVLKYLQKATGAYLVAYGLADAFIGYITVSLAVGLAAAFPFILYEILAMVAQQFPEFSGRMRLGFWLVSVALFYLGVYPAIWKPVSARIRNRPNQSGHLRSKIHRLLSCFHIWFWVNLRTARSHVAVGKTRPCRCREAGRISALRHPGHYHRVSDIDADPGHFQPGTDGRSAVSFV